MTETEYVDQMLQGLLPQLNQPGPNYLPTIIQTRTQFDPQASPYVGYPAGSWPFGSLSGSEGQQGAANICTAVQPYGAIYLPAPPPNDMPSISLSSIMVKNLSMANVASLHAAGPDNAIMINAVIAWGTLQAHGFAGIEISGRFSIVQQCCSASDGVHCDPNTTLNSNNGTGSFVLSIPAASVTAQIPILTLAPGNLTLGVQSIDFQGDTSKMSVTVTIDNIPHADSWATHAQEILDSPAIKQEFNTKISQQLMSDQGEIAQALTQNIDAYLQSTHQYPYGNAFAPIF
jgi:hypothetical protein